MFIRDFGNIQHHRGDTLKQPFKIKNGEGLDYQDYSPNLTDKIYWALMEPNQPWEQAIVKKEVKADNLILSLEPKDTVCLLPGIYYYQFKIKLSNGDVFTLTPKTSFYIME